MKKILLPLIALSCFAQANANQHCNVAPVQAIANDKEGKTAFTLSAELLYWDAKLDGMTYVLSGLAPQPVAADTTTKARYHNVKTNFEPGVRLGALLTSSNHDMFELGIMWTYHEAKKKGGKFNSDITVNGMATPTVGTEDLNIALTCAPTYTPHFTAIPGITVSDAPYSREIITGNYGSELNLFDFEIARKLRPFNTTKLLARPHFGLRYASVDSDFCVTSIESGTLDQGGTAAPLSRSIRQSYNTEFKGLGLRFGLDTQWLISRKGFSLFANAAWSYICGDFDTKYTEKVLSDSDVVGTGVTSIADASAHVRDEWYSGKAIVDTSVGLMYEALLNDDSLGMTIKAGWEYKKLFGMNQFIHLMHANNSCKIQNHGDLMLRGFTLSARLDF